MKNRLEICEWMIACRGNKKTSHEVICMMILLRALHGIIKLEKNRKSKTFLGCQINEYSWYKLWSDGEINPIKVSWVVNRAMGVIEEK